MFPRSTNEDFSCVWTHRCAFPFEAVDVNGAMPFPLRPAAEVRSLAQIRLEMLQCSIICKCRSQGGQGHQGKGSPR
jgi:hypothetical protein